ncbi:ATP-binding protein [Siminovitchia acidinfaciens]|uniref:ATP-binding protein n=1 Tax=Siminovitchia acidinfaciens TaxID=2321395 RepID=A0A429Y4A4_9BACI|nr:ATP-binding protein [Siminovitchia acidinfaciens]RST76218.1 ATP-binding protein [Siminovitchia acidinfaciens]
MIKKENLTAGIADPYWYEWSVGLLYALDLLCPDKDIRSIVLQASKLQGLDDVVVNFHSGEAECIQIKHTRENDSLTFSDMIRKKDDKDNKGSYLHQFSSDWQKASKEYKRCNAILFTNRHMGVKKYNVKESDSVTYERPALETFWPYIKDKIKNASKLEEICVKKEWETAWKEWLDELNDLDNVQKLDFLKSFDIKATQEDLNEIINSIGEKISSYFKVDTRIAVQLHKSLCYALMKWTTTLRKKEDITKEDLLEALSLSSDSFKGIHDIPTTEPFFESRADFSGKLEDTLKKRDYPVVFLSGEPGSGKTNIVSYLTNKIDSVITIRFYAFKPLTSDDLYLSADKGVSDPRALWGDLLIQLRELLKGKLAKYQVPISNELLSTTDELRNEVLRLSAALANETGNTTVICIDGIDHAARAGGENTFLGTLIPPEGVPKDVCFLIAGQPIHEYKLYPDWLSDEKVLKINVPKIEEQDIRQLYREIDTNIPEEYTEFAIKIINEKAKGNTLSVIFAMYEAKRCDSIEQLDECLNDKKLSSGINNYYEYIWKSALENIPSNFFYVDGVVAGVLSLINKKIKTEIICDIYGDPSINENAWKRILQKLYPVVIEEDGAFRVFHNDVRIYLERYLRKNLSTFTEVASKIADYYLNKSTDSITKHELVFELLKFAGRTNDYIEVYTKEYVIEALNIFRPMNELVEQLEETLRSLVDIEDYRKIISFSCAVSTLYQFKQSLQWADRVYKANIQLPTVLFSEKKVMHRKLLTIEALLRMFGDVELLIEHEKVDRARYVLDKWLSNLTPEEIIEILIENHQLHDEIKDEGINDRFQHMLEEWGMFCQYTGINFGPLLEKGETPEYYKAARAYFAKGWLAEGKNFTKNEEVIQTVEALSYHFKDDLEAFIVSLMEDNNDMVLKLTQEYWQENFSNSFKLKVATWAITNSKEANYRELINNIAVKEFSYVEDLHYMSDRDNFPIYALVSIILSYRDFSFDKIINSFINTYRQGEFKKEGRRYHAVYYLLSVSSYLGYMHKCINEKQLNKKIFIEDFKMNVRFLLSDDNLIGRYEIGGIEIERYLLTQYIDITNKTGSEFSNALQGLMIERAGNFNNIRHIDIYWSFLKDLGENIILEDLFDYWMSENGIVWEEEIADMIEIAENFINNAFEMGWIEKAENAQDILKLKSIGYVGRKEYSLFTPLQWYKRLDKLNNSIWGNLGLELLNISKNASELGDNRAAVFIDSAVATSAGREGYQSLWKFANLNHKWNKQWLQTIFDGVISSFEAGHFAEEELIAIWELSTNIFFVYDSADRYDTDNTLGKIYIADIKEGILLAANRLGYSNIKPKLKQIAKYEFGLERTTREIHSFIIPNRWFDCNDKDNKIVESFINDIKSISCEEAMNRTIEQYTTNKNLFRWDFVVELIQKYKKEHNHKIEECSIAMYNLLMERESGYYWEYDGANRAFEAIFPYLDKDKIRAILDNLISNYFSSETSSDEVKLFSINSDLENFSYCYYETLAIQEGETALNLILEMHNVWLTGNGILPLKTYYTINEALDMPENWLDFCNKLNER